MFEFADKNIKTVTTTFCIFQKVSRQKQSKWFTDRAKTINFLEENIRENLFDFEFGKTSLYTTVEVLSIKEKIDRINQNLKLLLFEMH